MQRYKRMWSFFRDVAAICGAAIGVCALLSLSANPAQADDHLPQVKTIAIHSELGDNLLMEQQGLFSNSVDSVSVGDWTLNAKAESAVSDSLSAGFHIVPAGDPNADAIVIISPRVGPALGAGPMQVPMTAIGVLHVNSPFGRFKAVVHAMYTLSVVDAKTGAVLTSASGKLPNTDFFGEHADPIEELPASVWPDNPKMLANGQRAAIKESVERLLAGSLRYTSQTLLLTTTN